MADAKAETKAVMDGTPKALAGVFAGSLMVMAKAAKQCDDGGSSYCEDYEGWALACSVIGVALSLTMIILLRCMPDFKKDTPYVVLVFFLAALWIAGVGTMTFKRPYKNTADNGYFGAWIATLSAMSLVSEALQSCMDGLKSKLGDERALNWWFQLFAASFVAMVQSGIDCDAAKDCEDELAWAVAASSVSFLLVIVMIIIVCVTDMGPCLFKWMSLGLVVWWIAGVGVSTYKKGPYVNMGNGYFSMWLALFASFQLFGILFFAPAGEPEKEDGEDAPTKEAKEILDESAKGVTGYITALFLTSSACMIAASLVCDEMNDQPNGDCKEYEAWAVGASAVSVILTLFLLIVTFLELLDEQMSYLIMIICSAILFAVWIVGTYTMTFKRPFKMERGNGYFGAWLSLILSFWWWTSVTPGVKEAMAKLEQYGGWAYQVLAIASLIEGLQAAHDCHEQDCDENHLGFAVAAGWVSFIFVVVVYVLVAMDCWNRMAGIVSGIFFALWWSSAAGVLTYDKPYLTFGNAYVGIWLATICSWLILVDVLLNDGDGTAVEQPRVVEEEAPEETGNEPAQEEPVRQEDAE